jgi:hypothetical protein
MAELSMKKVGELVLDTLEELVGCPAEGITGVAKDGDHWTVTAEVLELGRIPETTDVMASYEVTVDTTGEVVGYRRTRRYLRAQVEDR